MASGSIYFFDNSSQYLQISGSASWAPGLGDYTVEWWQYQNVGNSSTPRIFGVGSHTSASLAVDMDLGTFVLWESGSIALTASISNWNSTWVHMAVARTGGIVGVYENGYLIASASSSANINDSASFLYIGIGELGSFYQGAITEFNFVNGTALYTASFYYPYIPTLPNANSKLLLGVTDSASYLADSSGNGTTVYAMNGASYSTLYPSPQSSPTPTPTPSPTPTPTLTPTPTPSPTPTPTPTPTLHTLAIQPLLYTKPYFPLGGGEKVSKMTGRDIPPQYEYTGSEVIEPYASSFLQGDRVQLVASQNKYSFDYFEIWPPNTVAASSCFYVTAFGFTASFDPRTTIILNDTTTTDPRSYNYIDDSGVLVVEADSTSYGIVARYR